MKSLRKQAKKATTPKAEASVSATVKPATSEVTNSREDWVERKETVSEDELDSEEESGGVGRRGRE